MVEVSQLLNYKSVEALLLILRSIQNIIAALRVILFIQFHCQILIVG